MMLALSPQGDQSFLVVVASRTLLVEQRNGSGRFCKVLCVCLCVCVGGGRVCYLTHYVGHHDCPRVATEGVLEQAGEFGVSVGNV